MQKKKRRINPAKKPINTRLWVRIVCYIACPFWCLVQRARTKVDKEVRKIKGPKLILATHQSFIDFPMLLMGVMPRMVNWIVGIDEYHRGEFLMYSLGGIPKKKYTHDIVAVKYAIHSLRRKKKSVVMYPEAGYEYAGINERIDKSIGKLIKLAGVPVIMCKCNGNFLDSPQWDKHPYRRIRKEAHMYVIANAEEVKTLSSDELQARVDKAFIKDEYKWQVENNLHIKSKFRAKGLHNILYKCPHCGQESQMDSAGIHLWCNACGSKWEMDTLSRLHGLNTDKGFSHVPDWYRWEREEVRKEVRSGNYKFTDDVKLEDFYSGKVGFVDAGVGKCVQDKNGWLIEGVCNGEPFTIKKDLYEMISIHLEYHFKGKGDLFEIPIKNTTYYVYPLTKKQCITKIRLAQEELYDYYVLEGKR